MWMKTRPRPEKERQELGHISGISGHWEEAELGLSREEGLEVTGNFCGI